MHALSLISLQIMEKLFTNTPGACKISALPWAGLYTRRRLIPNSLKPLL